jgi:hypothetical protein
VGGTAQVEIPALDDSTKNRVADLDPHPDPGTPVAKKCGSFSVVFTLISMRSGFIRQSSSCRSSAVTEAVGAAATAAVGAAATEAVGAAATEAVGAAATEAVGAAATEAVGTPAALPFSVGRSPMFSETAVLLTSADKGCLADDESADDTADNRRMCASPVLEEEPVSDNRSEPEMDALSLSVPSRIIDAGREFSFRLKIEMVYNTVYR